MTGCDGTGKTTQANLLSEQLHAAGIRTRQIWLRFPFFFSMPLLGYARLLGYSWYEETNGVRHGYWDFRRSWLMKNIFPWLLLLDATLAALWKVYLPLWSGCTLVCERFVLDMLADLAIACQEDQFTTHLPGRLFLHLLPHGSEVIFLDLDPTIIHSRRVDLVSDRMLIERLSAFRSLARQFNLPMLDSNQSISEVNCQIWEHLNNRTQMTAENVSAYGKFRSRGVRVFLKTPVLAVILHWIFQSLFYMDPTERWFKISLDYLMAGAIAMVLRLFLAPLAALAVAIALAHTINFLLNGQLWGVLKHYGLVYTTPQAFEQYLSGLSLRALKEPSIQNLYVYGSLARQEWSPLSDLDVRLVRHPGVLNGLRACWFVLKERSRALLARFPIDIYVMDQASSLNKLRPDEPAVAITELEHLRVFSLPPSEIHNR